jgi:uncharacterized membrane protein YkvA (DUF1232 family)
MFAKLKEKAKQITQNLSVLCVAYKRKDVPMLAKVLIAAAVIYALSPLDLIPDFIPVLGYLDDLILLPLLIFVSIRVIPKNILEECREAAKGITLDRRHKKWHYGIPVMVIWIIIGIVILKNVAEKTL